MVLPPLSESTLLQLSLSVRRLILFLYPSGSHVAEATRALRSFSVLYMNLFTSGRVYLSGCLAAFNFEELNDVFHLTMRSFIYIYIRGGTVHRCHSSVRTSVRGSRFDTISVQHEKKRNLLCSVSFHLF